ESDYDIAFKACVLIRCPGETNYTAVDIQIAYEKRTQCRLRYSPLVSGSRHGVTEYVSHTNSSIQVRVRSEDDDYDYSADTGARAAASTEGHYGAGFYKASGAGDLAFYRVMRQCLTGSNTAAEFDCLV
ncbi:hypothetical protein LSAT2_016270, partial [Lamellibrachia satsuma]